jgi:purine nucleosidase
VSRKLLLDVDVGCDDAVMAAMALGAADLEVIGVTTVAGNTTVENTTHNALAVLELLDCTDVPVARGADRPLVDDLHTAESIHGPGGLRGELPMPTVEPVDEHAARFLAEQVREHEPTVVAVGPPTNLATALVLDPDLPEYAEDVRLMGGAARVAGNRTPAAEANFRNDPVAARRVVADAEPYVVGLDATDGATVPRSLVEEYRASEPPLRQVGAWLDYHDSIVHDAAVVADLLADVLTYERHPMRVDTSEGPSRGALIVDENRVGDRPANGRLAVDVDTERFRETLRATVETFV